MPNLLRHSMALLVLAAAAECGGSAPAKLTFSCVESLGDWDGGVPLRPFACREVSGTEQDGEKLRQLCTGDNGFFAPGPCTHADATGGCRYSVGGTTTTTWFYVYSGVYDVAPDCARVGVLAGAMAHYVPPPNGVPSRPAPFDGGLTKSLLELCIENVSPSVPDSCTACVCAIDDNCRSAVQMDKCDDTCWGLIQCIETKCPDFARMAMMSDYSCLTTNCAAFRKGAMGATSAGSCVTQCMTECSSLPSPDAGTSDGGR